MKVNLALFDQFPTLNPKRLVLRSMNLDNLHTIEAKVSPDNRGAVYLLETLGFEKETHFKERVFYKNQLLDMAVYTVIKENIKLHI